MRSSRNKAFIEEVRQYIDRRIYPDDVKSPSLKDRFQAWTELALSPWIEGHQRIKRNGKICFVGLEYPGLRSFVDFENANIDFEMYYDNQEKFIKRWLQIDKLSPYMVKDGIDVKFYSLLFPIFDEMLKENTGKNFKETVKELERIENVKEEKI